MAERLQKLLASGGHGSRRQIEEWIRAGRVTVDGHVAVLGERAEAAAEICLDGARLVLSTAIEREVLLYHKPSGEVTTRHDPENRPTVFERLPTPAAGRWIVIGRLDVNTTGLLLFTTDGALAHRLMHPSSEIEREYLVRVQGLPEARIIRQLLEGVMLEDGMGRFERIEPTGASEGHAWYRVILREGRNREVRRMWSAVGFEVSRLKRLRFGSVQLPETLGPGRWCLMPPPEAAML
jgi:23S rRNA pseudouridine2605 synthase